MKMNKRETPSTELHRRKYWSINIIGNRIYSVEETSLLHSEIRLLN